MADGEAEIPRSPWRRFLLPKPDRKFLLRLALVILAAWLGFKYIMRPMVIHGESMAPAHSGRGLNFCWRPAYLFKNPKPGDVVVIRLAGGGVMYLKRVLATEGQTVEFRNGVLHVDGLPKEEPYVKLKGGAWTTEPRKIAPGCVYVAGDNRSMPKEAHEFGETEISRIDGAPLW
jgi:signal peptidase I